MKNSVLYALWGGLFVVCAGLGFIPEPAGLVRGLLTAVSVLFFLPPAALLWRAIKNGDSVTTRVVRNLSMASLGMTVLLLLVSILTAAGSARLGDFLHGVLTVVSTPMICSGQWALTLFLWACLLITALKYCKK